MSFQMKEFECYNFVKNYILTQVKRNMHIYVWFHTGVNYNDQIYST